MWTLLLHLLFLLPLSAFECDLGSSDLLFVVKASHTMERDDFKNIKDFMSSFIETMDIGRSEDVISRIHKFSYSVVDYANKLLSKENKRMKKIVLIHIGQANQVDSSYYQSLVAADLRLRITEIIIDDGVFSSADNYYNYYMSYNDPYRRYVSWMHQLYPNMSIPVLPNPTVPSRHPKTVQDARILLSGSEFLCSTKRDLCNSIFACPPCSLPVKSISTSDQESPLHKTLPNDFGAINSGTSELIAKMLPTETKLSKSEDDYEYEIVGDPPSLKINPTPLRDDSKKKYLKTRTEPSSTTTKEPEYDYEDEISTTIPFVPDNSEFKRRTKRSRYPELRQNQCSCEFETHTSGMADYSVSCPGSRGLSPYRCHYESGYRKGCSSPSCSFTVSPEAHFQRHYYQHQQPVYTGYTNYQPIFWKQLDPIFSKTLVDNSKPKGVLADLSKKKEESLIYRDANNYVTKRSKNLRNIYCDFVIFRKKIIFPVVNEAPSLFDLFTPKPPPIHDILSKFDNLNVRNSDQQELHFKSPDSGSDLTDVSLAEGIGDISVPNEIRRRRERSLPTRRSNNMMTSRQSHLYPTRAILTRRSLRSQSSPIQIPASMISYTSVLPDLVQISNICSVSGVDVVAYIDDTSFMSTAEFENVKIVLMNVYKMFQIDPNMCNALSRIAILKVAENSKLMLVDELMQIRSHTEHEKIISSIKYVGCDIAESNCSLALPRSRIIEEAVQYGMDHRVRIVTVIMNREAAAVNEVSISLDAVESYLCRSSPPMSKLTSRKQYCPWVLNPIVRIQY
uniref:VWFA domain-containing protein n=1 Tax=Heterorhabditis bacteriophora TaxID=37862 RepID=A0A1I7XCY8_HETBA